MIPTALQDIVISSPDTLGGTPRFAGTRVPARALFDYMADARPVEEFMDHFPSVPESFIRSVLKWQAMESMKIIETQETA